jgi:hypothetical protein
MFALFIACKTAPDPAAPLVYDDAALACDVNEGDQSASLFVDSAGHLVIDWADETFWAIAITTPGAQIQRGGLLESGRIHWGVGGEDFGSQLTPPLTFGVVPERATDYTAYMGGLYEELDPEHCYEVQFSDPAHLGFGRKQFRLADLPLANF